MLAEPRLRLRLLDGLAALLVLALMAVIGLRAMQEVSGTNSYSLLASAFLHGRLDVPDCFDVDCANFDGRKWVIFPPAPAIVALPFVALFGEGFAAYMPLTALLTAITLWLWWRIMRRVELEPGHALWLLAAIGFATPVFYITARGDEIWFFAQVVGTLFLTLAIHEAMHGRLVTAGSAVGIAFLSRQMLIFQAAFVLVLALPREMPLIGLSRAHLMRALKLGAPIAVALGIYLAYNAARFGNPLDTGYGYINAGMGADRRDFIDARIQELGLFSKDYLVFNLLYLFVQGFHIEFVGRYLTELGTIDKAGTSLLAASPFVMLAVFAPARRELVVGALVALVIGGITLFYHSNGYSQYNTQRYTLDWLPVVFLALAMGPARQFAAPFRLLVTYALGLNTVAMLLAALTAT